MNIIRQISRSISQSNVSYDDAFGSSPSDDIIAPISNPMSRRKNTNKPTVHPHPHGPAPPPPPKPTTLPRPSNSKPYSYQTGSNSGELNAAPFVEMRDMSSRHSSTTSSHSQIQTRQESGSTLGDEPSVLNFANRNTSPETGSFDSLNFNVNDPYTTNTDSKSFEQDFNKKSKGCCSTYYSLYNSQNPCKRYTCRGCCYFWVIYLIFLTWSICDLLPMILETDYEKLYTFNYLEIEDVCDAENVPYNVDMDFRLPFNGELIHINEVEVSVFKNNNPNKVRGYLDKTKVVKTTLQPLWDNGNIVKGGNSKMSFASTAKITDMEGIGALGSDMMNEYDFQSIASLKVPIFTARLMFPIWTTVEMDMYYTCGFSEVNSYGEECDLSWGLTEKSLSRKCEYVCQFDDYPIMPLKHWYPSLYASDRGIDSDNIVIPDLVEDLCKGKERGDEDRRRTRRTTASTDGSRSLKEVYWDVSELPNYLEEMSRTDPKYELQEKWQEFHYCDPYKSFCSYSEVIQSLRVFSDPHSDLPTRKTMAEINMRMLLGAMPVKVKVPSVDMDIFYSNIDILPDASNSPVFVKDRIVKARSSEISKTLDWELSMGAEAFIAGPDGDEGNPTEGQLKDLQDGIGDFMELNNMFMYMRGSQQSELEETCDLQKLVKKMKPMRITVYSNLTNAVVCGMDDEDSDSDSSKQSTPSPTPSPTSIDETGTHQMVDCPYGECVRYKALELDPFYMTRVDIISAEAPTIFAIANFTLNLPFIVSGDFPKVVLDVNSGDGLFCVVEIEAMTMEDKLDESNQNIPTFAHVNLTVADMTTFRDKMAAINSFDEMELWISGSRTVGLESDYFFSLVSTLAVGFDIPMGSIVNSTAIASSSSSSSPSSSSTSKPAPNAPTAPPNATYPDPFIKIFVESKEDTLNVPITTLLSPSLFPVPISVGMRDLHFNLFDRHDDSALRFAVHDAAVIKSFCEWTLDPFYCSFGGDNYVNASFNVVTRQEGETLNAMIENATEWDHNNPTPISLGGGVTYPDHWWKVEHLFKQSSILTDCETELAGLCLSPNSKTKAFECLTSPANYQQITREFCLNALTPKGNISVKLKDMWDIPHMMQMADFSKKTKIPYVACVDPCPYANPDHWYFEKPDGTSFNQPDSTPSSTPTSTASPNPPFKLAAFTFNHFRSGYDPLDMDCAYESFEGLRTFRNSHCTPNNRTSLALSMGAEAFVGMTGISGTDLELRLNKLTAVVEYKNKTEEAERLRPSLLSRVRIVDGICKDHETEGLGGGVKNLTVQVGDTARLAEFAGGNHQETVRVFFEQEGDLLSRILALSAFAAEFPPQNNSFAGLSSLETVIDFPVLSCNTNQECFIVNNFEVSVTDSEGGGKLDSDSFAFVYPTYSTNFDVTGYFQGGVDNLPPGTMVAKVGARRRLKSSIVEYDESNSFGLTIKCQTLPQNTVAQYFTIDTYTFPDEEVSSFGVYDMMVEISSSTEECGQSVLGFTGDVVGQVAVVKPIEQDYGPDGPGGGGNNDNGDDNNPDPDSTPNPNPNQNNTTKYLPLSIFILELNSTETTVGLYNKMVFDASFDGGYTLNMPEIDLRMVNIALGGVTPTPPEEGDDLTDAMQYCQTTGLECSIMSLQQSEIVVGTTGNSEDTQGVMKAIVGSDGSTDLFNQVCNEGLKGLPVGLSLQGTVGAEQFIFDFVPFRVPKSARVQQDNSQPSSNTRRTLLLDAAASIVQRTSSSRKLNDEISEDDIFDAGSGFERIDPWLRNTSIYKNSDVFLSGIEVLRLSTLNTSFDTHWQDSDEPFKLFTETLTNLTTNIFQELFAVELTLPDVTFMASLAIEELPGWNTTKDDGNWYVGNLDSSGLPMTQFAELIMKGGTWSSSADFAEFEQAWTMINNTLLQRGLGEFVSRNQNITIRGQGARTGTNSLLERMLNYVRFDYTFPAKESNLTRTNYMGPLPATSLPQQTGGVKMLSATINGASSRKVETGGESVTVNTEFLREGVNCANCQVQVHLGWVRTGDGVAARDFTCAFDDNPDEEAATRYTQTVLLPTPVEAGDYFLAFEVAFDYGCSMSFPVGQVGTVPSVKKIGALRVLNTGVSDGGRRLISNSIEPEECGGNFMNNRNESGLSCAVVGTEWVVRDSNDLDSTPDSTTRRNLKEYTGNEGLRIEGGIYSEEDFFEFNTTVDIWPHIFANVPVDFRIGAVHVSVTDRSRSTELLTFDLHDVNLPALVGGRVGFELKANKVEHEAAIIDFVEDLFDATVSSRSLGLDVTGYIEGSKGRKKIDLGIIVSQADGRGYFDIQEQGTRRMLRRLFLDKLRQIVPFLTPDEELVNDYGEVVNPYDMEILQHDSPSSFIKTIHRMLEDDEKADDEKDQTPYGGSVAKIDIIGGSEIGETIRIPCVVESVCPPLSDADFSAKTDLLIMAEYFFTIPGGLEVYFDTPKISLDVDCCVHTKVMSLTVLPDTINNADLDRPFVGVVSLEIEDAELMYQSFSSIGTTFAPVYRIHGNPNTNMLSNIISTIQFKYDMTPKSGKKMMCKDDTWVTYNNLECYKLFTGATLSHAAAETACANEGPNGKLLQVVNEEENDWIRDQFYSEGMSNSAGWIGLDDLLVDGVWRWGDGSTGGFTNWAQSALSEDDHHCALMSPTTAPSTSGGEWIVDSCATARPYICEVDSIDWAPPGTPSPTTTRVPTPAPTSLSQVCEPLEMRGDSGDVTNKNSWDTFFYPTKCQGTWRLVETDADNAYLEITWPGMELPVQVLLPTCSITLKYEGIDVGTITPGSSSDLILQQDGTTGFLKVHIYGSDELQHSECMSQKYVVDPTKCQLAKLIDTLLKGAMENGDPLDLSIEITYDHPLTDYNTQTLLLDISLFQKAAVVRPQPGAADSTIVDPTRAPTPADSYCSTEWDRLELTDLKRTEYYGKCCDECYNDFVAIYNNIAVDYSQSIWSSLDFWNDPTIYMAVEICNVFPFNLTVTRVVADAAFDDPDGTQGFMGTYPPQNDFPIAEGVSYMAPADEPFIVKGGECRFTPKIPITASVTGELLTRLMDEGYWKSRLCLSIKNMVVDAGMIGPSGNLFQWTQPLDLSKISVIGNNDCVAAPDCNSEMTPKVQQNFDSSLWTFPSAGKISIENANSVKLNTGGGAEKSAMWMKTKHNAVDDFSITATVAVSLENCPWTGCWSAPHAGNFGLVIQQKSADNLESGDYAFGGMGANSLGVFFDDPVNPTTSEKALVYSGGDTATVLATSFDIDFLNDGNENVFRVTYSAHYKTLQVHANSGTTINENLEPKITLQIDLNTIFTQDQGYAWFGVTDNIVSGSYSIYRLKSFEIGGVRTDVGKCVIEEEGLVLSTTGQFILDTRTSCDTFRFSGGDLWSVQLKNAVAGDDATVVLGTGDIVDLGTGQYRVNYEVEYVGNYKVWATLTNDGGGGQEGVDIGSFIVT